MTLIQKITRYGLMALLLSVLAACGGGGGSGGTPTSGGSTVPVTVTPTIALTLTNATTGAVAASIDLSNKYTIQGTVRDSLGALVANRLVNFTVNNAAVAVVTPASALTNAIGVAQVSIAPASLAALGASSVVASATVDGLSITATKDFAVTSTATSVVSTATLSVTDFVLFTDKTTLKNNGSDKAVVTAVAVDASRNVVAGADVRMTVDQNAVLTPAAGTVTDATGSYAANVVIGSDKTDRLLTVQATINGIVKRTTLQVAGSKLTLQISPSTPAPGQNVSVTSVLVDASGSAIPNAKVTFGGSTAATGVTVTTDFTGSGTMTFAAPTVPGAYIINASASGVVSTDAALQVFNSVIPNATIPAGATPSLAASPNVLAVNSPGTSTNKATLRFLFLDPQSNPIQNVRVRFDDLTTGLPRVGSSISTGASTVYTDASGVALAQYFSGQNTSSTNGVTVRACYSAVDFVSGADCPNFVISTLTVAGQALAVSIGDDNLLGKGGGGGTYIKKFVVTVADSAGKAVPNAPVDISVDLTQYGKGLYSYSIPSVPAGLTASTPIFSTTTVVGSVTTTTFFRAWCANEDYNRNGVVDLGENPDGSTDTNGQATLQPRKSDLVISYVDAAVKTTDASGILLVQVEYSQRFATWLAYKVRVTANVGGSQGTNERPFVTSFVEGDDKNGSFLITPYGVNSCNVPN